MSDTYRSGLKTSELRTVKRMMYEHKSILSIARHLGRSEQLVRNAIRKFSLCRMEFDFETVTPRDFTCKSVTSITGITCNNKITHVVMTLDEYLKLEEGTNNDN